MSYEVYFGPDCGDECFENDDYFLEDFDGNIEVYVDGACSRNGRPDAQAGLGVWFNDDHRL